MHVLIFSTAYVPLVGGAEVAVKELTDRLPEIEFDMITVRFKASLAKEEKIGNVFVYRIGFGVPLLDKLLMPFIGALKTLQLQKKNRYSAYWCIMASFASGAAYIANWFQKKVPIIMTLQEGDSEEWLRYRWLGFLDLSWRLSLQRTTTLTAISTYLLDRAKRLGFKGRAVLIPNGAAVKKFTPVKHRVFDKEHVTLITTSRLVEKNGVEDLIRAMTLLPKSVSLQILGIGPLESRLKRLVKELDLAARVTFLGFVSQHDVPQALHEADIFVRPSLSEGQGISFIEAMAAGLPVVATPIGGIPDFITEGETGVFCHPADPASVAAAVSRIISDANLRERLIANGLELVTERYDWDLIAAEMKSKVFGI